MVRTSVEPASLVRRFARRSRPSTGTNRARSAYRGRHRRSPVVDADAEHRAAEAFALLALLLASLGLYGVLSTPDAADHEIGVRMALGHARDILLSFSRRGLTLTLAGPSSVSPWPFWRGA